MSLINPKRWLVGLFFLLLLSIATSLTAQQMDERAVKATFLVKLMTYITWPNTPPTAPMTICVLGPDFLGPALDKAVSGQKIGQHKIMVLRNLRTSQIQQCDVAVIRGSPSVSTEDILRELGNRPVLTVTDARFDNARGMIHFAIVDGRVGFHIDDAKASQSGLDISSQVLSLALRIG